LRAIEGLAVAQGEAGSPVAVVWLLFAERVGAELIHCYIPPSSPMLAGAGYRLDEEP
jgi:hypothetical protein